MKLKLLINDYCLAEQDICPPNFTELLFEDNCTLRKFYVDCIKRKMELECAGMMRGRQCRFVLVAESRVNQILEAQDIKFPISQLKKVI